jgi:hypothetical protein
MKNRIRLHSPKVDNQGSGPADESPLRERVSTPNEYCKHTQPKILNARAMTRTATASLALMDNTVSHIT